MSIKHPLISTYLAEVPMTKGEQGDSVSEPDRELEGYVHSFHVSDFTALVCDRKNGSHVFESSEIGLFTKDHHYFVWTQVIVFGSYRLHTD